VALLSLLGFYNNIAMILGHGELVQWPVGHLWTISVEMQFYVLYGVALFFFSRRLLIALLFLALFAAPALRLVASLYFQHSGWSDLDSAYAIYAGSFVHSDSFALGALLAFASSNGSPTRLARPVAVLGAALLLLYCVFYFCINYLLLGRTGLDVVRNVISGVLFGNFREIFLYSALAMASAGIVLLAVTEDRTFNWLLRIRVLQRIGKISYGAYIYHALSITAVASIFRSLAGETVFNGHYGIFFRISMFAMAYAITIATAEISYRHLERRFNRIGNTVAPGGKDLSTQKSGETSRIPSRISL
jgi:peptidoglycan/LPS O-acetylase OafA/YrhL